MNILRRLSAALADKTTGQTVPAAAVILAGGWQPTGEWQATLHLDSLREYGGALLPVQPSSTVSFSIPVGVLAARPNVGNPPDIKFVREIAVPGKLTGAAEWLDVCQVVDGVRREAHIRLGGRHSIKDGTLTVYPGGTGWSGGSVTDRPIDPTDSTSDPCWDPRA